MESFAFNLHTTVLVILLGIVIVLFLTVNRKLSKTIVGSPAFMTRLKDITGLLEQRTEENATIVGEMKELFESNMASFEETKEILKRIADLNSTKMGNAEKYMSDYEESRKKPL